LSFARELSDAIARRAGIKVDRSAEVRIVSKVDSQVKARLKDKSNQSNPRIMDSDVSCSPANQNRTLLIQGLPNSTTENMLHVLFEQFSGFEQAKNQEKPGEATVEFKTAAQATVALHGLQGFRLNATHALTLSYHKS
jgi:U2 small nuclear ribonucleoprotein B''